MATITQGQDLFRQLQAQQKAGQVTQGSGFAAQVAAVPPIARMVIPGMITVLVKREKHPIIWWLFGAIPLGFAVAAEAELLLKPKA